MPRRIVRIRTTPAQKSVLRPRGPMLRHVLVAATLTLPVAVVAAPITVPNTFSDGQVARAADVNANFSAVAAGVNAHDGRIAALESGGSVGGVALVDGPTINVDASLGNSFVVTLGGNRTIANPTNLTAGQRYTFRLNQDTTGGRSVTWGSAFDLAPSAVASVSSLFVFVSDGTNLFSTNVVHNGVLCTGAGVTQSANKCTFAASGAYQKLVVSKGRTITVKAWGAGGGPPGLTKQSGFATGRGGHGGFAKATFAVPGTTTYVVVVGKAGTIQGGAAFGGGGASSIGVSALANAAGGGGGLTGLFVDEVSQNAALIVAGGGGGAGGNYTMSGGDACTGGTSSGGAGASYPGDKSGFGATATGPGAGGAIGRCGSGGMIGGPLQGGAAQSTCADLAASSGGGGGGYWGGGGAGAWYAAGGAGSSFIAASGTSPSYVTGGNTADTDYPGNNVALGTTGSTSGDGYLVVTW